MMFKLDLKKKIRLPHLDHRWRMGQCKQSVYFAQGMIICKHFMHTPKSYKLYEVIMLIIVWKKNRSLLLAKGVFFLIYRACYIISCIVDALHDDVMSRYWPFVRGIHRFPVNSPHKGQWRGALMFSLIRVWINGWVHNREAGDLRRYLAHYDVTVMRSIV